MTPGELDYHVDNVGKLIDQAAIIMKEIEKMQRDIRVFEEKVQLSRAGSVSLVCGRDRGNRDSLSGEAQKQRRGNVSCSQSSYTQCLGSKSRLISESTSVIASTSIPSLGRVFSSNPSINDSSSIEVEAYMNSLKSDRQKKIEACRKKFQEISESLLEIRKQSKIWNEIVKRKVGNSNEKKVLLECLMAYHPDSNSNNISTSSPFG